MFIVTASEMRECDRRTIETHRVPGAVLMERAGRGCALALARRFAPLNRRRIWIVCGKGNNGGDGLVLARLLHDSGLNPRVFLTAPEEEIAGDAALQVPPLRSRGIPLEALDPPALEAIGSLGAEDLLVDALLGTGFRGDLSAELHPVVAALNASPARVVAIDLPTGLVADRGGVAGPAVRADLTVTMGYPKRAFFLYPARSFVGEWRVVDIGIPDEVEAHVRPKARWVRRGAVRGLFPDFPRDAHKGRRGSVLIAGGSPGLTGAPCLAALAAGCAGAGLVRVAVPRSLQPVLATKLTEAMTFAMPETWAGTLAGDAQGPLLALSGAWDALVLGPGLGRDDETDQLVRAVYSLWPSRLVVDADGLNALAHGPWPEEQAARPPAVLTPHAGEMARLAGVPVPEVLAAPMEIAGDLAKRHRVVVVLKGTPTIVADPEGGLLVSDTGNPGLATGGSGDVLAGMIGTFLAQGLDPAWAGASAAYLHGRSADLLVGARGERSLLASQVAMNLAGAWRELFGDHETGA
jgi:NAD(P)H-hydrate epimerase